MTNHVEPGGNPCNKCGATLPDVPCERSVSCRFCSAVQPNPAPLHPLQEVIYGESPFTQLGRVASCTGPDAIMLDNEKTIFHLEDLIPVARAKEEELLPRMVVYAMENVGWFQTTLVRIDANGSAIVKNQGQAFQDDFFNQKIAQSNVRIPFRASDRRRATRFAMIKDRFLASPFTFVLENGVTAIFAVVGGSFFLGFLYVIGMLIFSH